MTKIPATLCLCILALLCLTPRSKAEAQLAVVVNRDNPISDLSLNELARLYSGTVTAFPNGQSVALTEYAPLTQKFYRAVLDMSTNSVRRHWIRVIFSGESAVPPTQFNDMDGLRRFLSRTPGAIGFVELSDVDEGMKVLTIDNLKPGDARYLVK